MPAELLLGLLQPLIGVGIGGSGAADGSTMAFSLPWLAELDSAFLPLFAGFSNFEQFSDFLLYTLSDSLLRQPGVVVCWPSLLETESVCGCCTNPVAMLLELDRISEAI
jgi:hypothetical protein